MVAEIGHLALILAFLMALCQMFAGLVGAYRRDPALMALSRAAAWMQLLFVGTMFLALATSFLQNDFSVALVAQHSNRIQPAIYRFAATWGNHEGSMVLWVFILAVQGASVAWFGHALRETLQARVLGVQAMIGAAFLGFSLFTSNPFLRLDPAPLDGNELNPLLQDPGLVFHPPVLYLGYVGFSAAFAFAIAALIEGRVDAAWARWVRPWVLASWIALTVGIAAGSCWAYYTLGWGGWWFWDPVENASLMPWLMGTALLHSSLVLEKRGALVSWTILLAILTFSLSLIGTFLVRSGVLTSVHAFALDAQRGVYILGIIGGLTGLGLALFAWRAPAMRTGALFAPLSREGGITFNNVFLLGATAAVFLGTFFPVFVDLVNGAPVSVGPPYYKMTFVPIFVPLLVLVSFGPMLAWKRNVWREVIAPLRVSLLIAAAVLVFALSVFGVTFALTAGGLALGTFLIGGAVAVLVRRYRVTSGSDWRRFTRSTPLATYGFVLAHAGLGVTTLGITAVTAFQTEKVLNMRAGQSVDLAGQEVRLESVLPMQGPNYQAIEALFRIKSRTGERVLVSQRRFFPGSQTQTTDAGIGVGILGNTYVSVGDQTPDGSIVVRMWDHPLVDWIWAGAFLMAFGGMLSLADRRLRIGFAAPAAHSVARRVAA